MPPKPKLVLVNIPHKAKISSFIHLFIEKVTNIYGDGHCGFRAFAGLRDMFVDDYHIIRYELLKELTGDDSEGYLRLIGTKNQFNQVKHAMTPDSIDPALEDK